MIGIFELSEYIDRATEQDNDASALAPGRHALVAEIVRRGHDPMVIFALARERQLTGDQQRQLLVYREVLSLLPDVTAGQLEDVAR